MSTSHCEFVWYELMTTDVQAATRFYRNVTGWSTADSGLNDRQYMIVSNGQTGVGGVMALPTEALKMGARPGWIGYIGVVDVDAYVKNASQAGGVVRRAAEDIPGVGRFAVMADPQGAAFVLFKGSSEQRPPQPPAGTPGMVGWHELHAGERVNAFAFYSDLFGWTQADAIDMGPMGIYQIFKTGAEPVGGMMTKMAEMPVPMWLYYVNVDDIDAAVQRVKDSAGQVIHGPNQVPGGNWIAQCLDPQGAVFALVGPSKPAA